MEATASRVAGPRVRQAKIVDVIREQGRVSVDELATLFSASRETIRRDLNALSEIGRIQKIHGGARLPRVHVEGSFEQRMSEHAEAKRTIARVGASLVSPGDSLFIDTGSTTLMFAAAIAATRELTVITNCTSIARVVADAGVAAGIYLLGGAYDGDNHETHGPMALAQIERFRARLAVITVGGIDAGAGLTDFNMAEAQVACAMVERSDKLVVLADDSKFGRAGPFSVCPLERVDYLVSNVRPAGALGRSLGAAGATIVC